MMPSQSKKKKNGKQKEKEPPFEKLMERIEGIVTRLEEGELSLEESLQSYEEGVGLVRAAQDRLDQFDRRLELLSDDGNLTPLALDSEGASLGLEGAE
jgi:exodeoxyribonuclease VII small subunit